MFGRIWKAIAKAAAWPFSIVATVWGAVTGTIAAVALTLINLDGRQMRSIFSLGLLGGIIALSFQNLGLIYLAKAALEDGEQYKPLFGMLQGQLRFNSGLIAWFAGIMGLVVWGADYFRAKLGAKSIEMGKGDPTEPPAPPSGDVLLDGGSASPASPDPVPQVEAPPPAAAPWYETADRPPEAKGEQA